jgi:hypothetical protein
MENNLRPLVLASDVELPGITANSSG